MTSAHINSVSISSVLSSKYSVSVNVRIIFGTVRSVRVCDVNKIALIIIKKEKSDLQEAYLYQCTEFSGVISKQEPSSCQTYQLVFLLGEQGCHLPPMCPRFDLLYTLKYIYILQWNPVNLVPNRPKPWLLSRWPYGFYMHKKEN